MLVAGFKFIHPKQPHFAMTQNTPSRPVHTLKTLNLAESLLPASCYLLPFGRIAAQFWLFNIDLGMLDDKIDGFLTTFLRSILPIYHLSVEKLHPLQTTIFQKVLNESGGKPGEKSKMLNDYRSWVSLMIWLYQNIYLYFKKYHNRLNWDLKSKKSTDITAG